MIEFLALAILAAFVIGGAWLLATLFRRARPSEPVVGHVIYGADGRWRVVKWGRNGVMKPGPEVPFRLPPPARPDPGRIYTARRYVTQDGKGVWVGEHDCCSV